MSACSKSETPAPVPTQTPVQIAAAKKTAKLTELKSKYSIEQIKKDGFVFKMYFAHPADKTPEQAFDPDLL